MAERRRVCYSGHVQGVGFRARVQRIASGHGVAGEVANMVDGSVELTVEGEPGEISRFLDAVGLELDRHIREMTIQREPVGDPPLAGFVIRY